MSHWFRVLRMFADVGTSERRYLHARGAVEYLIELIELKGRFKTSKGGPLQLLDAGAVSRHIKSCNSALGCVAAIVRGAAPPNEAQLTEVMADCLIFADGKSDSKAGGGTTRGGGRKKGSAGPGAPSAAEKKNPFQQKGALIELTGAQWKEGSGKKHSLFVVLLFLFFSSDWTGPYSEALRRALGRD